MLLHEVLPGDHGSAVDQPQFPGCADAHGTNEMIYIPLVSAAGVWRKLSGEPNFLLRHQLQKLQRQPLPYPGLNERYLLIFVIVVLLHFVSDKPDYRAQKGLNC